MIIDKDSFIQLAVSLKRLSDDLLAAVQGVVEYAPDIHATVLASLQGCCTSIAEMQAVLTIVVEENPGEPTPTNGAPSLLS